MDITITGRNTDIPERFREYAGEKTEAKVTQLADRAQAVEIKLKRRTDRQGNLLDQGKVEITLIGPGPVIRAEAEAGDKYAAFDLAIDKLVERLRRAKDKRKVHRGMRRPTALHEAAAEGFAHAAVEPVAPEVLTGSIPVVQQDEFDEHDGGAADYNPVVIREKVFAPKRLTASEAVDHMELLGHDFFLFLEAESGRPAVVYRRKGWDYGVIALDEKAE
ncbi:ribosome-associated translation inhibitor RaiA [Pseudoclavibacter alba]|uniref:Ribosome hibernation promoting factor n=1 Tax=Pseudoclavibacter albus TaxID=272241 RepID=A0ABT2HUB9_9MICO|nr:ribosome-associated translation inhibitor RaiA [Pseudoclavibacter alba]MBN6778256.1 ribosome-associated translation inhibitor RaiA [Pseudoclavibacter alba]MCT2041731.1 ribosome-associated translation inhibitor RaiA [Pseudoclavibacter alba]